MLSTSVRIVRAATVAAWVVATAAVLVLTVMPRVLPVAGRDVLIVRGSSMTPAIPIGAAIVIERTDATNVAIGDVVTFHAANDTVVTHRVVGLGSGTEPSFES
jgi:signal peptidase I